METALRWIIFITLVASVATLPASNYTRAANSRCPSAGVFCLDCETLAVCVDVGGQMKAFTAETCNPHFGYCSQSLKTCSSKNSYCHEWKRRFLCQDSGIYPDPYDCNVYHECSIPPDTNAEDWPPTTTSVCKSGKAYNYATGACDLRDTHISCQKNHYPVPRLCGGKLDGGPLPLNPNYYWMCTAFTLRIFKCNEGYIFNGNLYKCVADGEIEETSTVDPTTPAPTTFEPTTPEPTTPEPTTPEPTTPEPITPEPTTPEPLTPEPPTPEPTRPEPTTPEPTRWPEPTTPEPTRWPEPTISEPTTPEPTTPKRTTPEPTTPEPTTPEPTTPKRTTPEPTTPEQTTPEPTTPEPTSITSEPLCPDKTRNRDPTSCYHYYYCNRPSEPKRRACNLVGKALYFRRSTKECTLGICPYKYFD